MSVATFTGNVKLVWDDSVVLVFSFQDTGGTYNAGFIHQVLSVQQTQGTQTQLTKILQTIQQQSFQLALDPATWVETVKNGSRGTTNPITVVYDDSTNISYTTFTNQTFQLQELYSISG